MFSKEDFACSSLSDTASVAANITTGVIGLAIGVTLLVVVFGSPEVAGSCAQAAKWMAVSVAGLVVIKLLRDACYGYRVGKKEKDWQKGVGHFAFEAGLTIAAPIVGGAVPIVALIVGIVSTSIICV